MNLALLQSFGQNYPEHNDGYLDSGSEALTCAFNRRGNYLAVGCNDGRIAVWDFMTRGIAIIYSSHTHPITSLSWSRSSRKLLSSSTDWNVCLWDVLSGECEYKFRFPSPVLKAQFNPRNSSIFLVCPMKHSPVVVYLSKNDNSEHTHKSLFSEQEPDGNVVASFDRRGQFIITGNSRGKMVIIEAETLQVKKMFRLQTGMGSAVKSIEFARKGSNFLVNSADRIVRVYDVDDIVHNADSGSEPEALQKLQDLVNKTMWKRCSFSGNGQYIVAGTTRQHSLYIWDKASGSLVKMLTGQKGETLLDVVWHPVLPIICSVSNGVVNIWAQMQTENWSAYAPDFQELEENTDYEEQEDEFDIETFNEPSNVVGKPSKEDEDKSVEGDRDTAGKEDALVDVVTPPDIPAYYSSGDEDDDEEPLDWLPIAPEIEDPEEAGWGHLEPNLNELPMETSNTENKENISRKRSLSESNSTAGIEASRSDSEGRPVTKKVKVVDIILDTNKTTDVTDVKVEPFVDVQSLDDNGDLPELEGGRMADKSDELSENTTTEGKNASPEAAAIDSTVETLPTTNEQAITVVAIKTENDTAS